jgi:hypothetical protein
MKVLGVDPGIRGWKRALRLRGGDKEGARQYALQLFPHAHHLLARKKNHQRAEAALIAYVGIRRMTDVKPEAGPVLDIVRGAR